MSFYDYFETIGVLKDKEFEQYRNILKSGIWSAILFENIVILSMTPSKVLKDDRNRLHSVTEPSVQFRDGYSVYCIHGVRLQDEKLWSDITQRKLTTKQILQIQNTEQRRAAINHYGWDVIFDELDAKLINKSKRKTSLAELYRVSGLAENIEINLVKYKDPSTDRWYVSQVPDNDDYSQPIITADHAMAWKSWITLEEYQKELKIEA